MFSWMKSSKEDATVVESVLSELKKIYKNKLLPLEEHYQFHDFHSPKLGGSIYPKTLPNCTLLCITLSCK